MGVSEKRINLDEPRWDQSTYMGRAKHFFTTTNPLNLLRSNADLERARDIVTKYRCVLIAKVEGVKKIP
jgi:hypothetical protein